MVQSMPELDVDIKVVWAIGGGAAESRVVRFRYRYDDSANFRSLHLAAGWDRLIPGAKRSAVSATA